MKRTEITRDRKIVWPHRDEAKPGIRHFQILDTVEKGTTAVMTALRRGGLEEEEGLSLLTALCVPGEQPVDSTKPARREIAKPYGKCRRLLI